MYLSIRLTRSGMVSDARQLNAERVRVLWQDPLLRASNLLDALFHQRLVLCEADGDCRFYNAVLEAMSDAEGRPRPDVMFAHTGGKHRLPTAVTAMASVGVAVSVIVDIDVFQEEQPLRGIWEGVGGDWSVIADLRRQVADAVAQSSQRVRRDYFAQQVQKVIDAAADPLDEKSIDRIRGLARGDGGWRAVKRAGLPGIPHGQARGQADELVRLLRHRGVYVVPVGELEGFIPSLGDHGPAWVAKGLRLELARAPEAAQAREFVRTLGLF